MAKSMSLVRRDYRPAKPGEIKCSRCNFVVSFEHYGTARTGLRCFYMGEMDAPTVAARNTCNRAARGKKRRLTMDQANYESTATQHAAIRDYFQRGWSLTPLEALHMFGCMRLAAVVLRLRKREGMNIITTMEEDDTPEGRKRWARYSLDREVPKDLQHQDPDAAFFPATTQGSLLEEGRTCK